ncbi:hypothetical protein, partial [Burkholderia multivorans]|uniref:hypothetical protein n=1 Tax=Burkholderia multivorans TaxID=87883 RepID=UPI001C613123
MTDAARERRDRAPESLRLREHVRHPMATTKKRGGAGRLGWCRAAARRVANGVQYTGCPLIRLGSQVEKNGRG